MKDITVQGTTNKIYQIFIRNSSTGGGLTGLVFNSTGLVATYHKDTQSGAGTPITLATMTIGTYASGGFVEVDSTLMPGVYQFCPPTGALSSGTSCLIILRGGTNGTATMVDCPLEIDITAIDLQTTPMPANVTQIAGSTTAATNLSTGAIEVISGTAITGTLTNTAFSCSGNAASSIDNTWVGRQVILTSGTYIHSNGKITAYNGTTKVITMSGGLSGTSSAPSNGDTFIIV